MKMLNKIIFISLIMLVLFTVSSVSATQDTYDNSTLEACDLVVEEVSSSQDTENLEVQTSQIESNGSCEFESDVSQDEGLQAESNGSCEFESDVSQDEGLQAESNGSCEFESDDNLVLGLQAVNDDVENEVLAMSNYDDVLSTIDGCSDGIEFSGNYVVVCGFPIEKKYKIRILRAQLNDYHPDSTGFRTFDAASSELEFFQFNRNRWYMFLMVMVTGSSILFLMENRLFFRADLKIPCR